MTMIEALQRVLHMAETADYGDPLGYSLSDADRQAFDLVKRMIKLLERKDTKL
jgi:hypothetical protein